MKVIGKHSFMRCFYLTFAELVCNSWGLVDLMNFEAIFIAAGWLILGTSPSRLVFHIKSHRSFMPTAEG